MQGPLTLRFTRSRSAVKRNGAKRVGCKRLLARALFFKLWPYTLLEQKHISYYQPRNGK